MINMTSMARLAAPRHSGASRNPASAALSRIRGRSLDPGFRREDESSLKARERHSGASRNPASSAMSRIRAKFLDPGLRREDKRVDATACTNETIE